jgi:CxxC-x17-CxxC domain-containing protein
MEPNDQVLVCVDCKKEFTFTVGEQQFFEQKGFTSPPKRCKSCRELRRRDRGAGPPGGRGKGGEGSEYRGPAFRGSDPSRGSGGRGGGWGEAAPRPPRPRRAPPDAITEYRAPSFSPRPAHAPLGDQEEIDEEADSIGNRLEPSAAPPRGPVGNGAGKGPAPSGGGDRPARPARTRPAYPITCDGCGQPSSVPFRPQPGRPVYCQDCYQGKKETAAGAGPPAPGPARGEDGE